MTSRQYFLFTDVLRSSELEAALAVAVSPVLADLRAQRDLRLERLCPRAVRLSALIMRAMENGSFVNDAVGTPIPPDFTDPALCFDGRLLLHKLELSARGVGLLQVCDNQVELVMRVEKLRAAVLDCLESCGTGLSPWILSQSRLQRVLPPQQQPQQPPTRLIGDMGSSAGRDTRSAGGASCAAAQVDYRGGALEVGGVVVANWGPNLAARGNSTELASLAKEHGNGSHQTVLPDVTIVPGESAGVIAPPPRLQPRATRSSNNLNYSPPGGPPAPGGPPSGPPGAPVGIHPHLFAGGGPMLLPCGVVLPPQNTTNRFQSSGRGGRRRRRGGDSGTTQHQQPSASSFTNVNVDTGDSQNSVHEFMGRGCTLGVPVGQNT